jgi:hypothetical protein
VPAALARRKLGEWAVSLGYPNAEIFPARGWDTAPVGNYINMPYFGGERSVRYAYGPDGSLTVEEFLDAAEGIRVTAEQLTAWEAIPVPDAAIVDSDFGGYEGAGFEDVGDDELWREGRPSEHWDRIATGISEGSRNNDIISLAGLLIGIEQIPKSLAVTLVHAYNKVECGTPLPHQEVEGILKRVLRREARR